MNRKELWNIPNMITIYRLLMFPVILYFIISGRETLFAVFFIINMVSDFFDGYIARKFKMETEIGAKLDSFADNFNYVLAFIGLFVFKMDELRPHLISFSIFIGMLVLTVIISLIKFRKFPSFHLKTTKISGDIQALFFVCLFTLGFFAPLYYLMIAWGIAGAVEHITIQMIIPEMRTNVKGLYWILKEKRKKKEQTK
ncbi:MAG: CDP-alcohol phosphatidyltransferase family protein [Bacteroidales bacterium]|nr:CDP-alcohol phosphatidyltransferase family protein [Bacteroidales bacterium]